MVLHNGSHTEHGLFIWIFSGFEAKLLADKSKSGLGILFTQQNWVFKILSLEG